MKTFFCALVAASVTSSAFAADLPELDPASLTLADLLANPAVDEDIVARGMRIYEATEIESSSETMSDRDVRNTQSFVVCRDAALARMETGLSMTLGGRAGQWAGETGGRNRGRMSEEIADDACLGRVRMEMAKKDAAEAGDRYNIVRPDPCVDQSVSDDAKALLAVAATYRVEDEDPFGEKYDERIGFLSQAIALRSLESEGFLEGQDVDLNADGTLSDSNPPILTSMVNSAARTDKHATLLAALRHLSGCPGNAGSELDWPDWEKLSFEELQSVAREAHRVGSNQVYKHSYLPRASNILSGTYVTINPKGRILLLSANLLNDTSVIPTRVEVSFDGRTEVLIDEGRWRQSRLDARDQHYMTEATKKQAMILANAAAAEDVDIRFIGGGTYSDIRMPRRTKEAITETLQLYEHMGGRLDELP